MNPALRIALPLAVWLVVAPALAGEPRGASLTIRGTALLSSGDPVYKARVLAGGNRRTSTTTDDSGRFTLDLPLPDTEALARDTVMLQVWVAARGLHFAVPDGQSSLGLVLKLERGADGVARVSAISNDDRLAERAARAVASGTHAVLDSVRFTGDLGEARHDPFPPLCSLRVEMPVAGGTTPASANHPGATSSAGAAGATGTGAPAGRAAPSSGSTTGPSPGSAAGHAAPPSGSASGHSAPSAASAAPLSAPMPAHAADSLRYTRTPEDAMGHPAKPGAAGAGAGAATGAGHCACRIAGTIETTGGPLREPLRLIVSLEGLSTPTDTVTLDMGSPRAFDLRGVPCGARRLVVRPVSGKLRFNVLDPGHSLPVTCERDRRAQPQVVLVPR